MHLLSRNAIIIFVCAYVIPFSIAEDGAVSRKAPIDRWVTLSGCKLEPNKYNDGDSFHVTHGGKQYLFRLCYVDTPETRDHKELVERTTDQARYWNVLKRDLFQIADDASAFTAQKLSRPFTVTTGWHDARGASQMPRYFATIRTADGEDLAEALVGAGLARIYGYAPDFSGQQSSREVRARLKVLEDNAKAAEIGAWAMSKGSSKKSSSKTTNASPRSQASPTPGRRKTLDDIPAY